MIFGEEYFILEGVPEVGIISGSESISCPCSFKSISILIFPSPTFSTENSGSFF